MKRILSQTLRWLPLLTYISLILFFSSGTVPKEVKDIPDIILHTCEYMALGLFLFHAFTNTFSIKPLKLGIILVVIGMSIGILDEIIQSYTPTRDASLKDLFVDLLALTISQFVLFHLDKYKIPIFRRLH